ncbi:MAG: alpha/beta hydrolase [Firmicutes bacterium]|nr:alpha/beta hydrolase [Alicyclobacillaceae bacterium]MCL6498135.1 alpha/beta hydrolase [Bacillota bacterium]
MARECWVDLSHGRTRYFESGDGPPVLLLHGAGITEGGDSWAWNWDAIGKVGRVIAPDFLGWGPGDRFDREYSFAYLTDFVRELQDALGISKSHVIGHSMGGWVAALFAYESPNRVEKLVLVANGGMAARTLPGLAHFRPPSLDDLETLWARRLPQGRGDPRRLAIRDLAKVTPQAVAAYEKILRHMNDPAHRERYLLFRRLPHIQAPTLILWGRQDSVNALELGEEEARLLPHARLVVLEGGHGLPIEQPETFNRLVCDFLTAE